eukprot:scaffold1522_cov124-Pinguiococcus_pyrenoidosus.AAC.1
MQLGVFLSEAAKFFDVREISLVEQDETVDLKPSIQGFNVQASKFVIRASYWAAGSIGASFFEFVGA